MELYTRRLLIKDLELEDALRFSEYRNKKEVAKYQSWDSYSLSDANRRIKYCLHYPFQNSVGNYQLGVYYNGTLIGDLFIEISGKTTFTLGYTFDNQYWSRGFATEAVCALLDFMKEEFCFKICLCHVYEDNYRSVNLLKRNGFKKIKKSWFYQDVLYKKDL